jgi:EAL domain-containing protein (putative c-di-GMP-specific phosphodiesterase class I)
MIARKAQREAAATAESLPAGDGEPLDPLRLSKLQSILASLDLSAHIRRQSVCVMLPDHKPERVFDEIYVRIADLQRPLMPNVDFLGNRWLFQTLTQLLDTRVLALIARRPGDYLNGPISLNLNVDTLMSEAFLNFDEAIKSGSQQSIVIEIQAFDLIANVRSFMMGREFLHSRGYRLCLDGLNAITLPLFERDTLGFDLFKVLWDETLDAGLDSARAANFAKSIAAISGPRVIMARCQDDHAINFAHKLGLAMLQGRAVDSRLNPQARHRNRN